VEISVVHLDKTNCRNSCTYRKHVSIWEVAEIGHDKRGGNGSVTDRLLLAALKENQAMGLEKG
jgi:hypothetical protein